MTLQATQLQHSAAGRAGAVPPPAPPPTGLASIVGASAIVFSVVYLLSDVLEIVQGNFSTLRLTLTYAGEASIPFLVMGIYALQRPRVGRLALVGAVAYAYSYVFFTSTVVYALVAGTPNYHALAKAFGPWMTIHGLIMVLGGLMFGLAVMRAGVLPRWTGGCLMAGVVLVAAASGLPTVARTLAECVPAATFIGMGIALLDERRRAVRSQCCPGRDTL
jgi:hypothetical protein